MAKATISKQTKLNEKYSEFNLFPNKWKDWIFVGIIILSVFIFFAGVITTHEIPASDNFASISMRTYLNDASNSGEFPQWVPYIFSGMPGYSSMMITGDRIWDIFPMIFFGFTKMMGQIFANDSVRVMQYYIIFGIGMFLLMRTKKFKSEIAFLVAIAAIFSTGIIHWIMIGHNTKPITMAMLPFIFLLMEKLREKFSILFSVLLVITVHLFFESVHIQMMFYSGVAIAIYLILELISRAINKNNPMSVVRVIAILIVASGIAFMMSSDRYLAVQEYTKYSVRGSAPITQTQGNKVDETGGNSYEYATEWSFSPNEMISFLVPNYFGFGKLPYKGPATGGQETKLPTYWGQKIFEDVAPYMGIFIFFMAIIGFIYYRKDTFVQALFAVSIFVLFLSFGKNLSILYDFFFYYVPSFNKFRAPSMALALMQFSFPILAGYGFNAIFHWVNNLDKENKKYLNAILYSALGFMIIGLIFAVAGKSMYISALENTGNQTFKSVANQVTDLKDFVWGAMISDWLLNGLIFVLFAGATFMFVNRKLSGNMFFSAVFLLLIFDLWRVGWRPLEVTDRDIVKETFQSTDLVEFLQQDKSIFRIADFSMSEISPNLPAYFRFENVGGYHPAKLRVYQDMLDVADNGSTSYVTNPFLWNMLNVKYIITNQQIQQPHIFQSQQTGAYVYQNPMMAERAFFVDSIAYSKPLEILNHLKEGNFDFKKVAYLEEKINDHIEPALPEAKVEILERKNEFLKLKVNATGNNLLFLSEVYFPLWTATIDGKETKILKTNYAFRSIVVNKGEHIIELKYHSKGFDTGKMLSIISNIVICVILVFAFFWERRNKNKSNITTTEE